MTTESKTRVYKTVARLILVNAAEIRPDTIKTKQSYELL